MPRSHERRPAAITFGDGYSVTVTPTQVTVRHEGQTAQADPLDLQPVVPDSAADRFLTHHNRHAGGYLATKAGFLVRSTQGVAHAIADAVDFRNAHRRTIAQLPTLAHRWAAPLSPATTESAFADRTRNGRAPRRPSRLRTH